MLNAPLHASYLQLYISRATISRYISLSEVNTSPIIRHIPISIYWYGDCTYSILYIDVNWVRMFSRGSSKIKHVHVEIITRIISVLEPAWHIETVVWQARSLSEGLVYLLFFSVNVKKKETLLQFFIVTNKIFVFLKMQTMSEIS